MAYPIQQNQTAQVLLFLMIDSTDHLSPKTGLTPTVTLSKNGAAFASPTGAVTEIGSGWYKVAGNATDAATLGPLLLHATGTGADPCDAQFEVVAYNPLDATRLGLTALPNFNAGANGGLPTGDASGRVTVGSNADKTGYALTTTPPTAAQVRAEIDANSTKLDATVSSRSSHTAADIWAVGTRTLTSFGTLAADAATAVWGAASRTLSAFGFTVAPTPDAILTAFKADTEWKIMLADANGSHTFDPETGVMVLKDKAGVTTLATLTVTYENGIPIARASS